MPDIDEIKEEKYWYVRSVEETFKELGTTHHGLDIKEALKRLEEIGPNKLAKEDKFNPIKSIFSKFNSSLIYVLFGTALISLFTNHILEFVVVLAIIAISVIGDFIQEYGASKTVESLGKLTPKRVEVIREGKKHEVHTDHVVDGDIILLKRGMLIPADMRVVESVNLMTDESILTGEPLSKPKVSEKLESQDISLADRHNMVFAGTFITNGSGKGVVVETGLESEIGKISQELKTIKLKKSPLQLKIENMSTKISFFVIIVCVFFFIILMVKGYELYSALLIICAIAVSGIPESFPIALTLALSTGVRKLASENAIMKDLGSVETLGTTTVICTDKTGTLTENKMRVKVLYFPDGQIIDVGGHGYEPVSTFRINHKDIDKSVLSKKADFFGNCILCNNAELLSQEGEWVLKGEPTEGALLALAKSAGFDDTIIKEDNEKVYEFPFDPVNKYMITVTKKKSSRNEMNNACLKGAMEKVIAKCSHLRLANNKIKKLNEKDRKRIIESGERFSQEALRVLAFGTKTIKGKLRLERSSKNKEFAALEKGYIFEGLAGLEDPIRSEVYSSIKDCQAAGIKVVMITGDHRETAISIGKRLGLITKPIDLVVEGSEIDRLTDEELDERIKFVSIFARVTPDHKLRIVSSFQRKKEIVAMTGDGVNDAPALKKADIGISMGKEGTDVAREASNMILTNDSFATIATAVKEGRTIYSNIRRFIYYLLTGNIAEVSILMFAILIGLLPPVTPIMILFINLITSTFPSLALSVEPTHPKVMKQRPRNPNERLLSNYILFKIIVLIPLLLFGTIALFLWELNIKGGTLEKARTIAFATLILFELFHSFNARALHTTIFNKNFFKNQYMFMSVLFSLTLVLMSIYTTLGQEMFGTIPLALTDWIVILIVSLMVIVVSEVIKLLIKSEFEEQKTLQGIEISLE